jgi:hypothetical protein
MQILNFFSLIHPVQIANNSVDDNLNLHFYSSHKKIIHVKSKKIARITESRLESY